MDSELFNHVEKCRFCFLSFRESRKMSFRITKEVQKKFLKLTQIEVEKLIHKSTRSLKDFSLLHNSCRSLKDLAEAFVNLAAESSLNSQNSIKSS